uniref:Tc1-like transposase DDE domain-containing protein n=1 Tax=Acanthochromis polyacanthus TaxID=80966 RepID=A0A3Q1F9Z3_9TELE
MDRTGDRAVIHQLTINRQHYASLVRQLREKIKEKRRGMLRRGVLFHQDDAPVHKSVVSMATIHKCGFELMQHPPYSPDLARSDFYLFPNMKRHLAGTHYATNNDVIAAVNNFLQEQDKTFYENGMKALQRHWKKCVDLQGDYVEK